jgi:nitrate reductase NapE component
MPSPHLERKAKDALGDDAGEELAAMIDRIDPIRGDIAELRHHLDKSIADLSAAIERSAKEQTLFLFVAWGVLLVAIVGLYGTLVALVR